MQHILKTSHDELELTHSLAENYKYSSLQEYFYSFFWKSFKHTLTQSAHKKEAILMNYSSLYSDFLKDINNSYATPTDIAHVRESILYITETIEACGNLLEQLIAHSHRQEEILEHEKKFFMHLLESFHSDLINWTRKHEQEIFWEISSLESQEWTTSFQSGKAILTLQKKRLESHLENIRKAQQ